VSIPNSDTQFLGGYLWVNSSGNEAMAMQYKLRFVAIVVVDAAAQHIPVVHFRQHQNSLWQSL
jgi:hypothetical protein